MTAGLQIFDGGGNIVWDTDMFICRSLGYVDVGMGSGQVVDARFTSGIPWAFPVMSAPSVMSQPSSIIFINQNLWIAAPSIAFSGNMMLWTRTNPIPSGWDTPACRIYYGVR
jgi:hypothetical protein